MTLFVDGRSQNLGVSKTDGVDFLASYGFTTADMGGFTFTASGTYLIDHDVAITAVAPLLRPAEHDLQSAAIQGTARRDVEPGAPAVRPGPHACGRL